MPTEMDATGWAAVVTVLVTGGGTLLAAAGKYIAGRGKERMDQLSAANVALNGIVDRQERQIGRSEQAIEELRAATAALHDLHLGCERRAERYYGAWREAHAVARRLGATDLPDLPPPDDGGAAAGGEYVRRSAEESAKVVRTLAAQVAVDHHLPGGADAGTGGR